VGGVKYLIDTNILLEILLGQTRAREAKEFLIRAADEGAAISDFSLYSIGIRLFRSQQHQAYAQLIEDLFLKGKFNLISISLVDIKDLINI
jgi:predicted nucleic acid-binding protein